MWQTSRTVVPQRIIRSSNEAKDEDEAEEDNDEWDIGSERANKENKSNNRHHNGVVSLSGVIRLAESSFRPSVWWNNAVCRIRDVAQVHPMASIYYEYNKRERVPKYEFANAGDVHSDASDEIVWAGDAGEGSWTAALELKQAKNRAGEGKQESEDA